MRSRLRRASFRDDLRAYAAAGFDGIGIWEMKLGADDEANLEAVRASGLSVTNCVPLGALDPPEHRDRRPGGRREHAIDVALRVRCAASPSSSRTASSA